jgi:hypothetical protein
MANALGTAAHALDGDIAQLQADLATYLAAGGSGRDVYWALLQAIANTSGHTATMANVVFKGAAKGRISSAQANQTIVALTPGATYP